jgi:lipoprotein NlpI
MISLEAERQRLRWRLAITPSQPRDYIQRGMIHFQLGSVASAIADFDQAERLDPTLTPYLWQRGLAYYYAGRFEDGLRQFEVDLTVNGHDVEETVWRYLCQAQLQGAPVAREDLRPVRNDSRPVMAWVYQLFAGTCDADTVLRENQHAGRQAQFYSHLYAGLFCEAERDAVGARRHITQAAAMHVLEDYMGWLALVHQHLRGWDTI